MARHTFYDYLHSRYGQCGKLLRETLDLMAKIKVPLRLTAYDANEWIKPVIDFWNNEYKGTYRFKAFVFCASGHFKPLFKYGMDDFNVPIILYYNNGHFDGVQRAGNLFGMPYCFACETVYHKAKDHSKKCKATCLKCGRIGQGFPCKPMLDFHKRCERCCKTFDNRNCYDHHKASNNCSRSKECENCGVIWDVADNTRNGREVKFFNKFQ